MAFAFLFAMSVFLSPASAQQHNDLRNDAIVQRLDMILERLERIETRLMKLEDASLESNQWWMDQRGVMRANDGRPLGFWGIDGMPATRVR